MRLPLDSSVNWPWPERDPYTQKNNKTSHTVRCRTEEVASMFHVFPLVVTILLICRFYCITVSGTVYKPYNTLSLYCFRLNKSHACDAEDGCSSDVRVAWILIWLSRLRSRFKKWPHMKVAQIRTRKYQIPCDLSCSHCYKNLIWVTYEQ